MDYNPYALKIYTDGSCLKNPGGPGGIAIVAEYPENLNLEWELILKRGYYSTTNNRMELHACIEAFLWAQKNIKHFKANHLIVITDSEYISNNYMRPSYWKKKNKWEGVNGRPIENPDLWKTLFASITKITSRLEIKWMERRSNEMLKMVDNMAKYVARNPTYEDFGFQPGRVSRKIAKTSKASIPFPAQNQEGVIRIYRKKPVGNNKIKFKIFFEIPPTNGGEILNHYAYANRTIYNELHKNHCYKVLFNKNLECPGIEKVIESFPLEFKLLK